MPTMSATSHASLVCLALLLAGPRSQEPARAAAPQDGPRPGLQAELEQAFLAQGIRLDLAGRRCTIPVDVCVREELLEYLLVGPNGAAHESLFATGVRPSLLNTALLALGVEPGANASWVEKDPPPHREELARGVSPYDVVPPSGDGFRLYAAWREGEEVYFHAVDDLVSNLRDGRSLRRHEWVYLGSRMIRPRPDAAQEVLAADLEGNLINLSFFRAGNTLLTAALDDCVFQTIWLPNTYLMPPIGSRVMLIFSRERMTSVPQELARELPVVEERGGESR